MDAMHLEEHAERGLDVRGGLSGETDTALAALFLRFGGMVEAAVPLEAIAVSP